jgi:hypothetical protein
MYDDFDQFYRSLKTFTSDQYPGLEILSVDPIRIENWIIKASSSTFDSIFVVMINVETGDTKTGFFSSEIDANLFITRWINRAPSPYK